jgi:hypothetical protein
MKRKDKKRQGQKQEIFCERTESKQRQSTLFIQLGEERRGGLWFCEHRESMLVGSGHKNQQNINIE